MFPCEGSKEEEVMRFAVETINNNSILLPNHRIEVIANYSQFNENFRNIQSGENNDANGQVFVDLAEHCSPQSVPK